MYSVGFENEIDRCLPYRQGASLSERRNQTRAMLFELIYDNILQRKIFGIDHLADGVIDSERGLAMFETSLLQLQTGESTLLVMLLQKY